MNMKASMAMEARFRCTSIPGHHGVCLMCEPLQGAIGNRMSNRVSNRRPRHPDLRSDLISRWRRSISAVAGLPLSLGAMMPLGCRTHLPSSALIDQLPDMTCPRPFISHVKLRSPTAANVCMLIGLQAEALASLLTTLPAKLLAKYYLVSGEECQTVCGTHLLW